MSNNKEWHSTTRKWYLRSRGDSAGRRYCAREFEAVWYKNQVKYLYHVLGRLKKKRKKEEEEEEEEKSGC